MLVSLAKINTNGGKEVSIILRCSMNTKLRRRNSLDKTYGMGLNPIRSFFLLVNVFLGLIELLRLFF